MLKQHLCLALLLAIFFISCNQSHHIAPDEVTEVLTRYGKENPENEVIIETSKGIIRLKLYDDTPLHRANFIRLIKQGFYTDNVDFYRIIYGFMIQGGKGAGYDSYLVPPEFKAKYFHKKGALAMAHRDKDNPDNASSPTEFYIVQGQRKDRVELDLAKLTSEQINVYTSIGGTPSLDGAYTVFGEVTEGMDVVQRIAEAETYTEKPLKRIGFKIMLSNVSKK